VSAKDGKVMLIALMLLSRTHNFLFRVTGLTKLSFEFEALRFCGDKINSKFHLSARVLEV